MGRNVVNFSCHSCGRCCTEVVCLPTPWDVIRIARETGTDPYDFLEFLTPDQIDEVDDDDPTWLEVKNRRYMMALKRDDRGCYFLNKKTRLCGIYQSRPILCRMFPFKLEEGKKGEFRGFSLHQDVCCPLNRDGEVSTNHLYDLYLEDQDHHEDYDSLVEAFNERDYKGKKPEDFIAFFLPEAQAV